MLNSLRQVEIYIQLPSQLKHWQVGSIHTTSNNLGITSSCLQDEFNLRVADSLFNGSATVALIESCCPSISNAWNVPLSDLNAILSGIQLASGQDLEISTTCPKCLKSQIFSLDLSKATSSFNVDLWNEQVLIDGLTFAFLPPTYKQFTNFNINNYKYQKTIFQIKNLPITEVPENILIDLTTATVDLQLQLLDNSIKSISVDQEEINDKTFIHEYLQNVEHQVVEQLVAKLNKCIEGTNLKNIQITCQHCTHLYESGLNLDPAASFRSSMIQSSEEEITRMLNKMTREAKELKADVIKMIWFMRGAISLSEAMLLTNRDREIISKLIEENLQITKDSGLPFF